MTAGVEARKANCAGEVTAHSELNQSCLRLERFVVVLFAVSPTWRYVRGVTNPLDAPAIARRYRLATFGPPALFGADADTFLGQHGHHRRRLALLAVLAAAGERGRSRDQLLLLFWPDATQTRARHSLDQLLYALRSSLG